MANYHKVSVIAVQNNSNSEMLELLKKSFGKMRIFIRINAQGKAILLYAQLCLRLRNQAQSIRYQEFLCLLLRRVLFCVWCWQKSPV